MKRIGMKNKLILVCGLGVLFTFIAISCSSSATNEENGEQRGVELVSESVNYSDDSTGLIGFASYDKNLEGAPVILIVPEWWGLNDYAKNRAKQLSELGYFAFAVDMYGNGKIANNPDEAGANAGPFYANPAMANKRIEAALKKIKSSYPNADLKNVVAIGYCFGGSMVLNAAKSGMDFKGVVSFHGGLAGVKPEKSTLKAKVLVCHGEADQFVSADEVATFKKEMDAVGAEYTFKSYPNATHAFTNPDATASGKKFGFPIAYNEKADKASWKDFMVFMKKI